MTIKKLYLFYSRTVHSINLGKASLDRIYQRSSNRSPAATEATILLQLQAIMAWSQPDIDSIERLNNIEQPVLIVNGNHDICVPTINSYIMYQNMPNAHLSLYPDAGHGSIFQYPELFVREAETCLSNLIQVKKFKSLVMTNCVYWVYHVNGIRNGPP